MIKFAAPFLALTLALPAFGGTVTLTPANPQPNAASLAPGLAVSYGFGGSARTLADAEQRLKDATPGRALAGLSYLDTDPGENVLTTNKRDKVAAAISGFIKFDAPGTFQVEFISNDGLVAHISGQQVALFDGVHGCESAGVKNVKVPTAGWYEITATYFQRKGSACLLMDWSAEGEMLPVPDEAFAHLK
jgi:hypothetical protein